MEAQAENIDNPFHTGDSPIELPAKVQLSGKFHAMTIDY
jgi:hypothetical protein